MVIDNLNKSVERILTRIERDKSVVEAVNNATAQITAIEFPVGSAESHEAMTAIMEKLIETLRPVDAYAAYFYEQVLLEWSGK